MRSSVRAHAVLSLVATTSGLVAPVCVAHADEAVPSTPTGSKGETDDERFRRLKAEGDRALAEKRLNHAIKAYDAAIAIRRDPLVAGRLGLALSFFDDSGALSDAAALLHLAIKDVAGVSTEEKDAFWAAYRRVRKSSCKLEVFTNDAKVLLDFGGGMSPRPTAFFTFVKKGPGEAVGRLEGRADIRKTWDCKGNQDIELRFDFPPLIADPPQIITVKETVTIVREPIPVEKPTDKPESKGNRLGVLFGPSVVFGVAPSPAYGLSVSGTYKFERWSAMIGARGAYAFGPIEGHSIDVLTVAPVAGPCFRERWFTVCAVASLNLISSIPTISTAEDFNIQSQVAPGIGIGVGGRYSLSKRIALYVNGDTSILSRDVELTTLQPSGVIPVWNGGQFLATVSLGAELVP